MKSLEAGELLRPFIFLSSKSRPTEAKTHITLPRRYWGIEVQLTSNFKDNKTGKRKGKPRGLFLSYPVADTQTSLDLSV